MSQLDKIRIFLRDDTENYYRICSVSNPADYKGEHYLKIMFPDIKGVPLLTGHHDRGIVKSTPSLPGGMHEFSYHYRSGISHFKAGVGRVDSKRNMPTLVDYPALHLVRFTVRSLSIFEARDSSKIGSGDFILPNPFDGSPRAFEFAVSRVAGPWNVVNEQGEDPVNTYKIPLIDPNVSLHISDAIWRRPPMGKSDTLFEIYTHDNPAEVFTFVPLK